MFRRFTMLIGLSFALFSLTSLGVSSDSPKEYEHAQSNKGTPASKESTPEELYALALKLMDGKDVRPNPTQAVKLLTEAGDKGHLPSVVLLSGCFLEGIGVERNDETAVKLMAYAAQKGAADAQRRLGLFYYEGIGVPKRDMKSALHWFEKAADQKDPLGLYMLGTFYSQGIEVSLSESKAFDLFIEAAYLGEPRAQSMTAGCYIKGYGISQDPAEAYAWALIAADNGLGEMKHQLYPSLPEKVVNKARSRAAQLKKKIAEQRAKLHPASSPPKDSKDSKDSSKNSTKDAPQEDS